MKEEKEKTIKAQKSIEILNRLKSFGEKIIIKKVAKKIVSIL